MNKFWLAYQLKLLKISKVVLGICGVDLESLELHGIAEKFMELSGIKK